MASTTSHLAVEGGTPVRSEFLVFGSPDLRDEDIDEVVDSLRSGWIGTGPKVSEFEARFAELLGARHAVAVNSCTAALHLSLLASGVGPGDEVITTPMTFAASANAIVHTGATPVFVDIDPISQNLDPSLLSAAITQRTRALLPVHFAGYPCDMTAISCIAADHGLTVVEDAAHCIEGVDRGAKIGTISAATCFSFYVTKNVTTIEGGMVTTADDEWAERIKVSALHGLSKDAWSRYSDTGYRHYEVTAPGFKYNMTDVQAALGLHQLDRIDASWERRRSIWQRYDEAFAGLALDLPALPPEADSKHALHLYILRVRADEMTHDRDAVLTALQAENVGCGVHYRGIHVQPWYRDEYGLRREQFPHATRATDSTLSIPLSPKLTDGDVDDVIAAVCKVVGAYTA